MTSPFDAETLLSMNVRRLRKEQDLTQEELGERAGVTSQYLSKIERGTSSPTVKIAGRIADALGVSIVELFVEADSEAIRYYYTDIEPRKPRKRDGKS